MSDRSTDYYHLLTRCLSQERLDAYARRLPTQPADELEILAHYLWNISLSQALYPALQAFEIALRNNIHAVMTAAYNTPTWFKGKPAGPTLEPHHHRLIVDAEAKLRKRRKGNPKSPTPGEIIAELNLGFWVGLFNKEYDPSVHSIWRGNRITSVFPFIPPDESFTKHNRRIYRTRHAISQILGRIHRLRNRVSHHEPIWYWKAPPEIHSLDDQHRELLEVIGWMNPALYETLILLDEFPTIYEAGPGAFREKLQYLVDHIELPLP